jgi:hypothetical protein
MTLTFWRALLRPKHAFDPREDEAARRREQERDDRIKRAETVLARMPDFADVLAASAPKEGPRHADH